MFVRVCEDDIGWWRAFERGLSGASLSCNDATFHTRYTRLGACRDREMRGRRKQHYSGAPQRAGRCRSSAGFGRQRRLVAWWGVGWCVGDAKPTTRTVDVDGRRGGARVWAGASYIGMRAATVVVPLTRRRWQIAVGLRQRRITVTSALAHVVRKEAAWPASVRWLQLRRRASCNGGCSNIGAVAAAPAR